MTHPLTDEDLDAAIEAATRVWREPGSPSDWRNFEGSEHPDQRVVTAEYMHLTDIANAREDYLTAATPETRMAARSSLRAAMGNLSRYREDRDGGADWERDAARWPGSDREAS